MKALIIILSIIAFFVILLSVRLSMTVHFDKDVELSVNWLFIKFHILPKKQKKKRKKKEKDKKKKDKGSEEKDTDETVSEPKDKKKKPNIFLRFYRNKGVDGFIELLQNLLHDLKGMFGGIIRSFIIDDIFISMFVAGGDATDTAVKHGKTCSVVFPLLGCIDNEMRVKKHKCEIIPDFIYGQNEVRIHAKISVIPRKLLNSVIVAGVKMAFNVLLKFLRGSRTKKVR